jgi:hypothetical protein
LKGHGGILKEWVGGVGGLRGVVFCDDDNRIIVACSCIPLRGERKSTENKNDRSICQELPRKKITQTRHVM